MTITRPTETKLVTFSGCFHCLRGISASSIGLVAIRDLMFSKTTDDRGDD